MTRIFEVVPGVRKECERASRTGVVGSRGKLVFGGTVRPPDAIHDALVQLSLRVWFVRPWYPGSFYQGSFDDLAAWVPTRSDALQVV